MPIELNRVSLGPLPARGAPGDTEALVIDIRPTDASTGAEPRVHLGELDVTVELADTERGAVEVARRGRRPWSR